MDSSPASHNSSFLSRPTTRGGMWAGWMTLIAVSAVIAANSPLFGDAHGILEAMRVGSILLFMIAGVSALALALRALIAARERSLIVWVALVVGLPATTLTIAELTGLME